MTFADPAWLWALLALPLLAACEAWATRRDRERTARLVARPLWARVLRRRAEGWRWARLALLLAGAGAIALALARPQWGIVREKIEREGVDVVLVVDTSGSMATEDAVPSRFFLARAALESLVGRLEGDRFGLVAFEGEAYPLVPLTLDADAVGMFLDSLEPGSVPAPGSSLGVGLAKGLDVFADKTRRNKVMVLVSDGEDLEGELETAVRRAREAGVVVHTVGVGTEKGQPVPDFDRDGRRVGFKRDENGQPVVSRLHPETLAAIAEGTGGRFVRVTGADTSLAPVAAAIESMERKSLAQEYVYRKKERFQVPLGVGLAAVTLGLLLPPPRLRRVLPRDAAAPLAAALALLAAASAPVQAGVADELLLRPRRLTAAGLDEYARGNQPKALQAFEQAAAARPDDPRTRFNVAGALYKNGKLEEAASLYRALGEDPRSPLAASSRFNLGNALFGKQDFAGAARAYRDTLRLRPEDDDARHNLEMALRALEKQQREQQQQQQQDKDKQQQKQAGQESKDQNSKAQQESGKNRQNQKTDDQQPQDDSHGAAGAQPERRKTEEEKEQERFEKETGMPKERAMQLLDALQQNEKSEQRRLLAERARTARKGKDW